MADKKETTKSTSSKKTTATKKAAGSSTSSTKKSSATKKGGEFAVIESGGKQYSVSVGDTIIIEKLNGEHKTGGKVVFDKVLLVEDGQDTTIGTPYIDKAKVEGVLKEEGKGKKINIVKFKAKSRHHKQKGHRQPYMKVEIEAIK